MEIGEFQQRLSIRPFTLGELHGTTIEDDLQAFERTVVERCAAHVRQRCSQMLGTILAEELLAMLPDHKGDGNGNPT